MVAFAWQLFFASRRQAVSFRDIASTGNKGRMGRREQIVLGYGHFQTWPLWFMQKCSSTGRLLVEHTGQLQTSAITKVDQKTTARDLLILFFDM